MCNPQDAVERTARDLERQAIELAISFRDILSPEEIRESRMGYMEATGNANPYVPWANADIPYHCACGDIIYSDTEHFHPGDEPATPYDEAEEEYRREHDEYDR